MEALTLERPVARKAPQPAPEPVPLVTAKISRSHHARLKIVSSVEGKDIASIIGEMIDGPLEKRYKAALVKLNQGEGR